MVNMPRFCIQSLESERRKREETDIDPDAWDHHASAAFIISSLLLTAISTVHPNHSLVQSPLDLPKLKASFASFDMLDSTGGIK